MVLSWSPSSKSQGILTQTGTMWLAALCVHVCSVTQSCPTLCKSVDGSPPGSPVPGILQARTLKWVAISFFNAWKWKVKVKSLSRVRLLSTPWTAAYQAPPSMGFSRQEYWSGVPLPSLAAAARCPIIAKWWEIRWTRRNTGLGINYLDLDPALGKIKHAASIK